ncbi:MAG: LptF/LptG family permease [Desulfovibrionaceae bacterium]|nr:LptF/LptG family permease [Desulfovibrionaceae bacterium]
MRRLLVFGVLGRHLARQNMFMFLLCLGIGSGLYLLTDVFDRLDDFVSAGLGPGAVLTYFTVKIPLILSQIMPAVFFLAMIVQISLMARNRELLALRSGGVSLSWFVRFFVVYAVFWSLGQLAFSQYIGVMGEQEANRIWKEEVRKKELDQRVIKDIWFRDGPYIVEAREATPAQNRARGVTVYEFDPGSQRLARVLTAKKALVDDNGWGLLDVFEIDTRTFESVRRLSQFLSVRQDLKSFMAVEFGEDRAQLPLWELGKVIDDLKESGSNVERLRTAWHAKWAYAFSILVMALMALAVVSVMENVYLNVLVGLVLVFTHYGLYVLGVSAGQKGVLYPVLAAWMGNAVMAGLAGLRLAWVCVPGLEKEVRAYLERTVKRIPGRFGTPR